MACLNIFFCVCVAYLTQDFRSKITFSVYVPAYYTTETTCVEKSDKITQLHIKVEKYSPQTLASHKHFSLKLSHARKETTHDLFLFQTNTTASSPRYEIKFTTHNFKTLNENLAHVY